MLSSSQPTSSSTSSGLRLRNSSDTDTSTKCWWTKLLAASYSVVHIMVSANCRTPRQFLGWSLGWNRGGVGGREKIKEKEREWAKVQISYSQLPVTFKLHGYFAHARCHPTCAMLKNNLALVPRTLGSFINAPVLRILLAYKETKD